MIVRRIARPLLAGVFVTGGIDTLRNAPARAQVAEGFVDSASTSLPDSVTSALPSNPETLVKINAAVQIGGGLLLASGKAPRAASLVLAGSLVPTTLASHAFWEVEDPQQRSAQRTQFLKNLSILGGLLLAAVDTEGKPSLGWRGRRAARKAQNSVSQVLSSTPSPDTDHALQAVSGRARTAAGQAGEIGGELIEAARIRGTALAHRAKERGAELSDVARERGPVLAELARERGTEIAHLARERGSELSDVARERGPVLAELARERGTEIAHLARERGTDLAATASQQSEVLSKRARKQAEKARKQAEQALAVAREKAAELQD